MSKQEQSFSREEVVSMLSDLFNALTQKYANEVSWFPWKDDKGMEPIYGVGQNTMFGSIYGQMLSVIESTVEKDRVEPAKTVARQLLDSSREKHYVELHNAFCELINGEPAKNIGGWAYPIAEILNPSDDNVVSGGGESK